MHDTTVCQQLQPLISQQGSSLMMGSVTVNTFALLFHLALPRMESTFWGRCTDSLLQGMT
jgi:hypothetical protein